MIGSIITWVVVGLIVGALARAVLPGKDALSIPATIVLGILGAIAGGWLWRTLISDGPGVEWIGSILGGVLLLAIYRQVAVGGRGVRA